MKKKSIFIIILLVLSVSLFAQTVHNVDSDKALYMRDGNSGQWFSVNKGKTTISWQEKTRYGFAHAVIYPAGPIFLKYELTLVGISNSTTDFIEGFWDIKKNGVLVANGIVGKLYGIDQPVGQYFKFYGGTTSQDNTNDWHYSFYVTSRFDYTP